MVAFSPLQAGSQHYGHIGPYTSLYYSSRFCDTSGRAIGRARHCKRVCAMIGNLEGVNVESVRELGDEL